MSVFAAAALAIDRMRCTGCGEIMGQGERERNPRTKDGRPIHSGCTPTTDAYGAAKEKP